jgi:hypothetical protein
MSGNSTQLAAALGQASSARPAPLPSWSCYSCPRVAREQTTRTPNGQPGHSVVGPGWLQ